MTHSIDEARRGVEQSWSGVLGWAETEQRLSLWEFETKLWFLMLALGRAVVGLFLARQAARPSAALYQQEGQRYQRAEVRTSEVGTPSRWQGCADDQRSGAWAPLPAP